METPTISELFTKASHQLRAKFEFIRSSNPHPGGKGTEVEDILKEFLNSHMPKRFLATSGIIIDNENNSSKQTDVIVYDALSSPVYRFSETTQIIPADTVAAVIEVKTCLNKKELEDAYKKIASCKGLKKTPFSKLDQAPTGIEATTIDTLGIVFGFDSDSSLKKIAENIEQLNTEYDSKLWPDLVVVLDKGVIGYSVSFPGENHISGSFALPGRTGPSPPFYVCLVVRSDGEFSLNRFFCILIGQLIFYPRRPSSTPFALILEGSDHQVFNMTTYQFDTKSQLKLIPSEMQIKNKPKLPPAMHILDDKGDEIGTMQFIKWQDGAIIRWYGPIPLQALLGFFLSETECINIKIVCHNNAQLSSVLKTSEEEFRAWPEILTTKSNMSAFIQD